MVRRWVCGVVVMAVIFGSQGWSAPAMAQPAPSNYYDEEFWYAELGAVIGGAVGGLSGLSYAWSACLSQHCFGTLELLWELGRAIGAGYGVARAGSEYDVQGNVIMVYLLPGVFLSVYPITLIFGGTGLGVAPVCNGLSLLVISSCLPFVPAVLAVIGFNIGAKMKDTGQPASLPWTLDIPVLSLEF